MLMQFEPRNNEIMNHGSCTKMCQIKRLFKTHLDILILTADTFCSGPWIALMMLLQLDRNASAVKIVRVGLKWSFCLSFMSPMVWKNTLKHLKLVYRNTGEYFQVKIQILIVDETSWKLFSYGIDLLLWDSSALGWSKIQAVSFN